MRRPANIAGRVEKGFVLNTLSQAVYPVLVHDLLR